MFISILLFLASATFAAPTVLSQSEVIEIPPTVESLGEHVREYYSETPVLADIAWCESRMRHVGENGAVLRGMVDSDDIGVMQINTRYHQATADELELDIYSLHGNLDYARFLYDTQGTRPWNASRKCWDKIASL